MCLLIEDSVKELSSKGKGKIFLPHKGDKPLKNTGLKEHGLKYWAGVFWWDDHIRLDLYNEPDHKDAGYNTSLFTYGEDSTGIRPFVNHRTVGDYNEDNLQRPASTSDSIESMIGFISNFWQDLQANDMGYTEDSRLTFHSKAFLNRIYEWAEAARLQRKDGVTIAAIFFDATTNADGKKLLVLIEEIARTCHILRAGMVYTLYALEELSPYKFGFSGSTWDRIVEVSGINPDILNPYENNTEKEFDDVIARADTYFRNYDAGIGYGYTFKIGDGFGNEENILPNIKDDILDPSKYHNLFNTRRAAGTFYKDVFGLHVDENLEEDKSYFEDEIEIPSQLQDLEEEYDRAKQAIERLEE